MAELLRSRRPREHRGAHRHQLWHEPYGGPLRPLRCPFGPRVSRWSRAGGTALLHELGIPRLQAEEVTEEKTMECGQVCLALHRFLLALKLREITRRRRLSPLPWGSPACFAPGLALAFSDLSSRDCALRR